MIAQPFVPGPLFALMNQTTLPAAAVVSYLLLRRRYSIFQLLALLVVWVGGALALLPDLIKLVAASRRADPDAAQQAAILLHYSLLAVLGTIPTALSSSIKEKVFRLYITRQNTLRKRCQVNSHTPAQEINEGLRTRRISVEQRTILQRSSLQNFERCQESPQDDCTEWWRLSKSNSNRHLEFAAQKQQTSSRTLDVFVISAYGSMFQLLFVPLSFPVNMLLGQVRNALL